jgi:hypothetical protein
MYTEWDPMTVGCSSPVAGTVVCAPANVTLCAPAGSGTVVSSISTVRANKAAWVIRPRDRRRTGSASYDTVKVENPETGVLFATFTAMPQFIAAHSSAMTNSSPATKSISPPRRIVTQGLNAERDA